MSKSRPPAAAPAAAHRPYSVERVRAEADRHDRSAVELLKRGQRIAAALQRGLAMGLREACELLGGEAESTRAMSSSPSR